MTVLSFHREGKPGEGQVPFFGNPAWEQESLMATWAANECDVS